MASPYDKIIQDTAAKYQIPVQVLDHVVRQESGYNPQATSPRGAEGLTQLMPDTARSLGVTDAYNPEQNLTGGAKYLKQQYDQFGSWPLALAAYNAGPNAVHKYGGIPPFAETQNYVKTILAGVDGAGAASPVTATPAPIAAPAPSVSQPEVQQPARTPPLLNPQLLGLLNQNNAMLGLPKLSLPSMPPPVSASPAPSKRQAPSRTTQAATAPAQTHAQASGLVSLAPNADRAGAHIHPQVVQFVGDIAALYGKPLEIGTGTNHNEYVVGTHRESAHWTGWAADVPATGDALTKLGYSALLAAGMSPQQALPAAKRGGLFNLNGYQIIFKTTIGGNHWNHLHVGLAPSRQSPAA